MNAPAGGAVTVGGSDVGAVCGVNPYRSPIRWSAEQLGLVAPRSDTERMSLGRELEPYLGAMLSERGYGFVPAPADGFQLKRPAWWTGHPDGFAVVQGERAVAELKNVGGHAGARDWTEWLPAYVELQANWYLALTGLRRYVVGALIAGERFAVFEGERNDGALELAAATAGEAVKLVRRGKLLAPDASDDARAVVRELYPEAEPGKVLRATGELWDHVQRARDWKYQRDLAAAKFQEHQTAIEAAMGDAEYLISPRDAEVARFATVNSSRVDTKSLRATRPEIAEEYTVHTTTRRFTLQ